MKTVALFLAITALVAAEEYKFGPDSERHDSVPKGTVTQHSWTSKIFPGTTRDYWVYVPAQYKAAQPAALLVLQDGGGVVKDDGSWRVPLVLDNLIHKGAIPVTIGVFINPGVLNPLSPTQQPRLNRSFEYDALGDRYSRFLLEEILPEVTKQYNITTDPNLRAIGGSSSGAICAFTVAWNRPDQFRRVLSFIGSYTNLRGGDIYPNLIRKYEPKPLRVFLQDGSNDLNIFFGSWWMANQTMSWALKYAGYDVKFVEGTEGHNMKQGGPILPDALRWVWADWQKPIVASKGGNGERQFIRDILDPASEWELVSQGHRFTEGPSIDKEGNVYFSDIPNNRIHKIGTDGKVSIFREDTGGVNGTMFGPDGRLYAAQNGRRRIVTYDMSGKETVLAEDVQSNDLAVTAKGDVYFTDPPGKKVWLISAKGGKRVVVDSGIAFPNGVRVSPDQSLLYVADMNNKWIWSYQIQPDGSLANGEAFYHLETWDDSSASGADGFTVDSDGYLYVATRLGIQICDQPGRVVAIISKPWAGSLSNAVFAGPDMQWLYVTAGDKVYRRHLRRKGVLPWEAATLPKPRL